MQPWVGGGGRQPTMVGAGNHHAAMGDRGTWYLFAHQFVLEVKIHRTILATHKSCLL